jgi:hypothetical protein
MCFVTEWKEREAVGQNNGVPMVYNLFFVLVERSMGME